MNSGTTWGIDAGYHDLSGTWHPTPPETRAAILAAMGVDPAQTAGPPDDPVRVVRQGEAVAWDVPGDLMLEGGTALAIAERLPPDLPAGYHDFRPATGAASTRIIVTPGQCVVPDGRKWGWSAQLYATRSAASWGLGDLADLRRLAQWSAALGAGFLMLSPVWADGVGLPQEPSPYYPCTRRFGNPLYLRVEDVPGAAALGDRLAPLAAAGRELNRLRQIDRDRVFRLKDEALRTLFDRFVADPAFDRFCAEQAAELDPFATYCALAERHGGDWRQWPAEYRNPAGPAVQRFAVGQGRAVEYHKWLQWLFDAQLGRAAEGMALVHDLPIGFSPHGADAWLWQDLLAEGCTIGAPPDAFNREGQDWQLPPLVPHKHRAALYRPWTQTLRAVLRHAGGLRIDHVMGLFRLFWIPPGLGPAHGAYVRYAADELLAILAVESQRAGAFVVGEDLELVEAGVRERLREQRLLSFRLLWFESQPPREYPPLAMAAVTTHDLPTIAGLWNAQTLADKDPQRQLRQRLAELVEADDDRAAEQVIEDAHRLLAEAPSQLLVATLEDALAVEEQPNKPGTVGTWPNWSLALPGGLEALEQSALARRVAAAVNGRANEP